MNPCEAALETLGLKPGASGEDIKRAYYKKMRQHHPDTAGNTETQYKLTEIHQAYRTLVPTASTKHPIRPASPQSRRCGQFYRSHAAGNTPAHRIDVLA